MNQAFNPQFAKIGEILVHNGKATESGIMRHWLIKKRPTRKLVFLLLKWDLLRKMISRLLIANSLGIKKLTTSFF